MITRYKIIKKNNEEILVLYLDFNYEFSKFGSNNKSFEEYIKEYIKKNKILFKGTTIVLLVSGIMISNNHLINYSTGGKETNNKENIVIEENINKDNKINNKNDSEKSNKEDKKLKEESLEISENNSKKSEKNSKIKPNEKVNNTEYSNPPSEIKKDEIEHASADEAEPIVDNNIYVTLRRSNGEVLTKELEEYIIGVVGYEMPASFNIEALKSQAVIARTYALKSISRGITLTDSNSTQGYKSNEELMAMWGSGYNNYYSKIRNAVLSTKGEYLSFNGTYIDAVYHSTSNGKTESSINVWGNYYPYLVSVDSPYDNINPTFQKSIFLSYEEISSRLSINVNSNSNINIRSYTTGNRVEQVEIDGNILTGVELRNKLGLRSADIEIIKEEAGITFKTKGYGHGVGLSQYGAQGYANNGYSYKDILRHYYTGVSINNL